METHARTIIKAVTYRVFGLSVTIVIAWFLTGSTAIAASIGVLDASVKIVCFYLHERAWLKIKFGRKTTPEYDI